MKHLLAVSSFPVLPVRDGATLRVARLLEHLSVVWRVHLVAPPPAQEVFAADSLGIERFVPVDVRGRWTYKPYQYDTSPLTAAVSTELAHLRPDSILLWSGSEFLGAEDPEFPPFVADRIDSVSLTAWRALRAALKSGDRLSRARSFLDALSYERRVAKAPATTVVVGEQDAAWLRRVAGAREVCVVPNGVDIGQCREPGQEDTRPTVTFTGVMSYGPNIDAVVFFARAVWPLVRAAIPEAQFVIAGREPAPEVEALANVGGIDILGEVPSIADVLQRAWVAVAPMRTGSGIKNKVLEAWAVGTPVVMTTLATNGLAGAEVFPRQVEDVPSDMATEIARLLQDAGERHRLGLLAYETALNQSWESAGLRVSELLEMAGAPAEPLS